MVDKRKLCHGAAQGDVSVETAAVYRYLGAVSRCAGLGFVRLLHGLQAGGIVGALSVIRPEEAEVIHALLHRYAERTGGIVYFYRRSGKVALVHFEHIAGHGDRRFGLPGIPRFPDGHVERLLRGFLFLYQSLVRAGCKGEAYTYYIE